MGKIFIKDLLARCIIGVNEEERLNKQDVLINIVLAADLRKAGKSDRFEDTVDYSSIRNRVVDATESSSYYLVEALAERIAGICLEHPAVEQVRVSVEKPSAITSARSVGVEITRDRT